MHKVCLVSCSKRKLSTSAPAENLYVSRLFSKARSYAKGRFDSWYILSALHGVVEPTRVIDPYDVSLNNMGLQEQRLWSSRVLEQVLQIVKPPAEVTILAGLNYRRFLVPLLDRAGFSVSIPLAGLGLGKQLQWLSRQTT